MAKRKRGYILSRKPKRWHRATALSNSTPALTAIREEEEEDKEAVRTIHLGEIWAFALESDGHPRSYARVDRIVPLPFPSSLHVTPLHLHPVTEEEMLCSENVLPVPCGIFRPSNSNSSLAKPVSAFAHLVPAEPDPPGSQFYRIFPKQGEIWAVYDRYVDGQKGFEYRLVEVVSGFTEESGVGVAALVEVRVEVGEEMVTVHRRQLVQERFSRRALFVFSHRVPATRIVLGGKNYWKVNAQ